MMLNKTVLGRIKITKYVLHDSGYCSDQAKVKSAYGRSGKGFPVGEINSSQTGTFVVVIKQSLGSWSHMWSLSNVNGCGSTSLFGSRAGTHQGK